MPIILLAEGQGVLVVHPTLPVKTVKEFVALAKARPGELNYGSAGPGTALHMAAELFKAAAKVNLTHIAYKGSGPAMIDLMSGQIQCVFENVSTAIPYIKANRIRALGVTSAGASRACRICRRSRKPACRATSRHRTTRWRCRRRCRRRSCAS